jgi:hypothetical protein
LSFATPLERVDTLETTDLHVGAPVLYSMKSDVADGNLSLESREFNALAVKREPGQSLGSSTRK